MRAMFLITAVVCAVVTTIAFGAERAGGETAPQAVLKIEKLYEEFLEFRNDVEFRTVGYGRCCKYYQWMKRVEELRGEESSHVFMNHFGILPGDLIVLGQEYYRGRGRGEVAKYFENLIASVRQPVQLEPEVRSSKSNEDEFMGSWIYTPPYGTEALKREMTQRFTIERRRGELFLHIGYSNGSITSIYLVELSQDKDKKCASDKAQMEIDTRFFWMAGSRYMIQTA